MNRVSYGLESRINIDNLKEKYEKAGYKYDNGLFVGGVLLFKNNERTIKFFNKWWEMIKEYSHRDQLSLNYVLHKTPELKFNSIKFFNIINKFFKQRDRKSKRENF